MSDDKTLRIVGIDPTQTTWNLSEDEADLSRRPITAYAVLSRQPQPVEMRLIRHHLSEAGLYPNVVNARYVQYETAHDTFITDSAAVRRAVNLAYRDAPTIHKRNNELRDQLQAAIQQINEELRQG